MRNLLEEFSEDHGVQPPSILGVREHIFTGRLGIVCNFLSILLYTFRCALPYDSHLELQCIVFGMVYVKPRDKLCDHWSESSCKTFKVRSPKFLHEL